MDLDKLRVNSRVKHLILDDYLPTWAHILGGWNKRLNYFDCHAGPGRYLWKGTKVEGSPIIAINRFSELLQSDKSNKPETINLVFLEKDKKQIKKLDAEINNIKKIPDNLIIHVDQYDSEEAISETLDEIEGALAPSFFFIDPYEHPFSLSNMHRFMVLPKTEILVNFMFYQIIRDIPNVYKEERCMKLFHPDDPSSIDFKTDGRFDEEKILHYLYQRIGAKYYIPFKIFFGPDERVSSRRLKYILIHYSNHPAAFKLMIEVMWKHSQEGFPLSVKGDQSILFPISGEEELKDKILSKYIDSGKQFTFNEFMDKHWSWYYKESHYRTALKELEKEGIIKIRRVSSKKRGLKEDDIIIFN